MGDVTAAELESLQRRYPILDGSGALETFTESATVHGVAVQLAGIATRFFGECATGSAASLGDVPITRAYMELLERLSILEALKGERLRFPTRDLAGNSSSTVDREIVFPTSADPETWRWARSSGVAVGLTWHDAARRARLELLERDRVLRSWYGEFAPESISSDQLPIPSPLRAVYDFEACAFTAPDAEVSVVGFFGLPRAGSGAPATHGFGARDTRLAALETAFAESLQPLGFLWGEDLPTEAPVPTSTPDFHQDYFLFPEHSSRVRAWINGDHAQYHHVLDAASELDEPEYVDLTPVTLASRIFVARAIPSGHVPLAFGARHPMVRSGAPSELWVHPIC